MNDDDMKDYVFSSDGRYIAIGVAPTCGKHYCVVRTKRGKYFSHQGIPYDWGGCRLALDGKKGRLFSGAYYVHGIAASDIVTGKLLWHRRDIKKVQSIGYDAFQDLVYCAVELGAARVLNANNGREKSRQRGLTDTYFSNDCRLAIFEYQHRKVVFENRDTGLSRELPRESWGIVDAVFSRKLVFVAWVEGPVAAYDAASGSQLWKYSAHVYDISIAADGESVWVVEQPYKKAPYHRLRLLSPAGEILREFRCQLGHSYKLVPNRDQVILADLTVKPIAKGL